MARIQVRVSVPQDSPLYTRLAALPQDERAKMIVQLAEAGFTPEQDRLVAVLERIATALERGGMPAPEQTRVAALDAGLERAFGRE